MGESDWVFMDWDVEPCVVFAGQERVMQVCRKQSFIIHLSYLRVKDSIVREHDRVCGAHMDSCGKQGIVRYLILFVFVQFLLLSNVCLCS